MYLDFHHTNPEENDTKISKLIFRYNIPNILKEIEKCIVLCAYCHRDEHASLIETTKNKVVIKRRKYLDEYKATHPCEICGETNPSYLDFHHPNPEDKEDGISELLRGGSRKRLLEEISKCKVLCVHCHRELHYKVD